VLIPHVVQHVVAPHITQPLAAPPSRRYPARVDNVVQPLVHNTCTPPHTAGSDA